MKKIHFDNLIARAKQDTPPVVDVADDVIARLSTMAQRRIADPYRPYVWMTVASAAIAACILIAATLTLRNGSDSVSEMITYVSWAVQ
ncbi:MAG: hypothetical protein ACYSUT_11805 [Planctomycetota bacterium]